MSTTSSVPDPLRQAVDDWQAGRLSTDDAFAELMKSTSSFTQEDKTMVLLMLVGLGHAAEVADKMKIPY